MTRRRDDIEVEEEPPPDRDSLPWLFYDPGVRAYVLAGLGALAMIFVTLFPEGGPLPGVLVGLIGTAGLVLRWVGAPGWFLVVLVWFLLLPGGVPPAEDVWWEIGTRHFRAADLVLAAAVVVYMGCQFRVLSLAKQSMPADAGLRRKGEKPARRPPELVRPGEFVRFLVVAAGVVLAAQLVWWVVTHLEVDAGEWFPFRWEDSPRGRRSSRDAPVAGGRSPETTRFLALAGLVAVLALLGRLVFGYWRLRAMGPDEAGMVLQEAGWDEARREPDRIEKWKAAAKARAEARGKAGGAR